MASTEIKEPGGLRGDCRLEKRELRWECLGFFFLAKAKYPTPKVKRKDLAHDL